MENLEEGSIGSFVRLVSIYKTICYCKRVRKNSSTSISTSTLGAHSPVGSEVPFGGLGV
jgi:hypothetical protein